MSDLGKKCYAQFDKERRPIPGTAAFDAKGALVLEPTAVYRCSRDLAHGGHCALVPVVCPDCKGTGLIHRKVWTQPKVEGVHPAIAASAPAYRTIASFPCPRGCKPV